MAKTELTKKIEQALRYYRPSTAGGITLNAFRGTTRAFEVPVECGTISSGIIDCVKINEYFKTCTEKRFCCVRNYRKELADRCFKDCKIEPKPKSLPLYCDHTECFYCRCGKEYGEPSILITCYEIKITVSDFKSINGHNFVGNLNYYVVPSEIYKDILPLVEDGIGVITLSGFDLRRRKDSKFRELTDEDQKWMILNVLKRVRRGGE
jgi:hypothetical protein